MNNEQQKLADTIQRQLDDGFMTRTDWPAINPLLFVTSAQNRQSVTISHTENALHLEGDSTGVSYAKSHFMKWVSRSENIQDAINICTKQMNSYLLNKMAEGETWTIMVVDVGQVQWLTWYDVDSILVTDPRTGIVFNVDFVQNDYIVTTHGLVINVPQEQARQKAFLQNVS